MNYGQRLIMLRQTNVPMRKIEKALLVSGNISNIPNKKEPGDILKQIELCTTIKEVQEAYRRTRHISEARLAATLKWDSLSMQETKKAFTARKARRAYLNARKGSGARLMATLKWDNLSMQEIERATTMKKTKRAHQNARDESEVETTAIIKLITFFKNK